MGLEEDEEKEALDPARVRDKVEPVKAKVLGAVAGKAGQRRVLTAYASVRNAVIPSLMSAECHARRSCARSAPWPCGGVEPRTWSWRTPLCLKRAMPNGNACSGAA